MFTIYALIDPRDGSTRYVGMTSDIYARLAQHIRGEPGTPEKNTWIQELKDANLIVTMTNLEQVPDLEEAREREVYWTFHYMKLNAPLLNQHIPILEKHRQIVQRVVHSTSQPRSRSHASIRAKRAAGEKRKQIKAAICQAMQRGESIRYQVIADAAGAGYSTVKLYARSIQQEIADEELTRKDPLRDEE